MRRRRRILELFVAVSLAVSVLGVGQAAHAGPLTANAARLPLLDQTSRAARRLNSANAHLAESPVCRGANTIVATLRAHVRSMACLINEARTKQGLRKLRISRKLLLAARLKGEEIQRCHVFDHAPCGGAPDAVALRAGYLGSFGENLYLGERSLGSPREALRDWLASRPHRENLFSPLWRVQSVYALRVGELAGFVDATLWVVQFGDR